MSLNRQKLHFLKSSFVVENFKHSLVLGFDSTSTVGFLCVSVSHSNRTVSNLTCKDSV